MKNFLGLAINAATNENLFSVSSGYTQAQKVVHILEKVLQYQYKNFMAFEGEAKEEANLNVTEIQAALLCLGVSNLEISEIITKSQEEHNNTVKAVKTLKEMGFID